MYYLVRNIKEKFVLNISDEDIFKNATIDIIDCLNSLNIKWFFIEGTLISVLRYGQTSYKLNNRFNTPDRDIDVMIIIKNQKEWEEIQKKIINTLINKNKWRKFYKTHTPRNKSMPPRRQDKLVMYSGKKYKNIEIHCDIHTMIEDNNYFYVHKHHLDGTNEWPFGKWGGYISKDIIYPFKKCLFNGKEIQCANKSIELLKKWNSGEYSKGCIALPVHPLDSQSKEKEDLLDKTELNTVFSSINNLHNQEYACFHSIIDNEQKRNTCIDDYYKIYKK